MATVSRFREGNVLCPPRLLDGLKIDAQPGLLAERGIDRLGQAESVAFGKRETVAIGQGERMTFGKRETVATGQSERVAWLADRLGFRPAAREIAHLGLLWRRRFGDGKRGRRNNALGQVFPTTVLLMNATNSGAQSEGQ